MRCYCIRCTLRDYRAKQLRAQMTLTFERAPSTTGRTLAQRSKLTP